MTRAENVIEWFGFLSRCLQRNDFSIAGDIPTQASPRFVYGLGFSVGTVVGASISSNSKFIEDAQAIAIEYQRKKGYGQPDSSLCYKPY